MIVYGSTYSAEGSLGHALFFFGQKNRDFFPRFFQDNEKGNLANVPL
jgi:hypothetical protein